MRQLLLRSSPDFQGVVEIRGKDVHYLRRVLRLKKGDAFTALNPEGGQIELLICEASRDFVRAKALGPVLSVEVEAKTSSFRQALPHLLLLQAWPKGQKADRILRQAVELGVRDCIFFSSDHSQVRLQEGEVERRKERLMRIAKEALQQSGALHLCNVHIEKTFSAALARRKELSRNCQYQTSFIMHQDALAENALHRYLDNVPDSVALAIGPEGGFSAREYSDAEKEGFIPILLTPTVLRVETAAIFAIAAVETIIMERPVWQIIQN